MVGQSNRLAHAAALQKSLEQAWDGVSVAVNVLALSIVGLILAIIVPGLGLVLGWVIASYAIGRGLFVAVAMRRMPRGLCSETMNIVAIANGSTAK